MEIMACLNHQQKEFLISTVANNIKLYIGKISTLYDREDSENAWIKLTQDLNKLGTSKTVLQWKKTLADIRLKIKKKLLQIVRNRENGSTQDLKLSQLEEKLAIASFPGYVHVHAEKNAGYGELKFTGNVAIPKTEPYENEECSIDPLSETRNSFDDSEQNRKDSTLTSSNCSYNSKYKRRKDVNEDGEADDDVIKINKSKSENGENEIDSFFNILALKTKKAKLNDYQLSELQADLILYLSNKINSFNKSEEQCSIKMKIELCKGSLVTHTKTLAVQLD